MASKPRDAVFTTALCKGNWAIADFQAHLDRLYLHAKRLRVKLPDDCHIKIAKCLQENIEISNFTENNTKLNLLTIKYYCQENKFNISYRELSEIRFSEIHGATVQLPKWFGEITGTKHGNWQPYLEAKQTVEELGADIALLIDDFSIVDSDRANVLVIDEDGTAWVSNSSQAVNGITQQIIINKIQSLGIPVFEGRLNERMVARSEEIIVLGTGLGCCRIKTIDGEKIGREDSIIFELAKDILSQHYSNPDTWTNMCEYLP
tara:strand:- start:1397 stop:2182 length:786 start_codon:yes stop_codon:yes gene_type:complete